MGVVLYEMLTGRLPFMGDTAVSVAMQHVRNAPPPPTRYNARIPRPVEAVILRALEKLPERRYVSGADLVAALRGNPVPGRNPSRWPVAWRHKRSPRARVRLAGGQPARARHDRPALPEWHASRGSDTRRAPRRRRGPGIGTWLLGIVLLGGLLALVYLGYKLANAKQRPAATRERDPDRRRGERPAAAAATPKPSASVG